MENNALENFNIDNAEIKSFEYFGNTLLKEITINDGTKKINTCAFKNCKNLKKIKLPDSLEYIGKSAFSGCENLEEIILPENMKTIDSRAFADCKNLKKIIIPNGIIEMNFGIFSGCENLEEIVLPESIEKLEHQMFLNCKKLKNVSLPKNLEKLPNSFFKGCSNLDIELKPNIKEIGEEAFFGCSKLNHFPKNAEKFGENCFKGCKKLNNVILNEEVKSLSNGMFDGCTSLNNIKFNGSNTIPIGKKCFRNCSNLKEIPNFIYCLNNRAFENCNSLTKAKAIHGVIPFACFRGCKKIKEIEDEDSIHEIKEFAFSGCENLEEVNFHALYYIPAEAFSNCKKLKKIAINNTVDSIGSRAFFNCYELTSIKFPDKIHKIGKEAFKNCNSIKEITIPENLSYFKDGAFAYMNSLDTINVSPQNKKLITPDHKILINKEKKRIVLYASGLKDKSYSLKDYVVKNDMFNNEIIDPIYSIGPHAFAGAKNLEELTLCSCLQDVDFTAFDDCDNLKTLNMEFLQLFGSAGINLINKELFFFDFDKDKTNNKHFFPFETINFKGNLKSYFIKKFGGFKNVKNLNLPSNATLSIGNLAFRDCTSLETVNIPKDIYTIDIDAFPDNTRLKFDNGLEITGLMKLKNCNYPITGKFKLYELIDGTYYIEKNKEIIKITQKEISDACTNSEYIIDDPMYYLYFMDFLTKNDLAIKPLIDGILMSCISPNNKNILAQKFDKNDKFLLTILKNSNLLKHRDMYTRHLLEDSNLDYFFKYVDILKKYKINDPILHNKELMANYDINAFERLLKLDKDLFATVLKNSNMFNISNVDIDEITTNNLRNVSDDPNHLTDTILKNNLLESFIKLIKKYDVKDRFLQQKTIISLINNNLMQKLIQVYDSNTKLLLQSSKMLNTNEITSKQNLSDLLNLMYITGALEKDPIVRQRATTFINEKLFDEYLPNGEKNKYRIFGDDIHRIFNFQNIRGDFDLEFANFFLENYRELIKEERKTSGFIQRVYLNFREISKTFTSNKGSQRKLKVTIDKCKNFLSNIKFDDVTDEVKDLALLIGNWYDDNDTWNKALKIYKESLKAPRNIFTKVEIDKEGKIIYDNDPSNDLKEKINDNYSFEWLPKQDYDNLVLGKYCNCCAHIAGMGQGIMRASMILDNCQNLVIRDNKGNIISKSTIYVNRNNGYAVFNTVETSFSYRNEEELKKIYMAILRGAKAFLKTYNMNNKDNPIKKINMGTNRNTIINFLNNSKHPMTGVEPALKYGNYSLKGFGYDGDWTTGQRLILKI